MRKNLKNKEYSNIFWVFEYLSLSFEFGYQTFWVFGFGFWVWVSNFLSIWVWVWVLSIYSIIKPKCLSILSTQFWFYPINLLNFIYFVIANDYVLYMKILVLKKETKCVLKKRTKCVLIFVRRFYFLECMYHNLFNSLL